MLAVYNSQGSLFIRYSLSVQKIDYVSYLQTFDKMFEYSRDLKNMDYRKYLLKMLDYLYDYLGRVKPLVDQSKFVLSVKEEFEDIWARGQFPGWRVRPSISLI